MRKRRGVLLIMIGVALAAISGFLVLGMARQAATPPQTAQAQRVSRVYVVVAEKDLAENVPISAQDLALKEFPAEFAPPGAISSPEIAVGKYTTARVFKGQILVAPLLAEARKSGPLAARVPVGKVAMAVTVNDPMNQLGALRAGDHVDVLLSLDLAKILATQQGGNQQQVSQLATQLTMQNVEILSIGLPAGETASGTGQGQSGSQQQTPQSVARTITFLLDHQDAVTLKFIKDSGGTIDLVVRSPEDNRVAQTEAVTLDSIYRQFRFRFAEPVSR